MNIPFLSTHRESALTLYRQRCTLQQQAVVEAGLMARIEQQLWVHLQVLSRSEMEPQLPENLESLESQAEAFVELTYRLLSPTASVRKTGYDQALDLLSQTGALKDGAFHALSLLPPPEDDTRMLDLYRHKPELRPLLFDLWREQSRALPTALVSVAELQSHDTTLEIAALRYAASQPRIGIELFTAYYQGLLSGAKRQEKSGHLLATALWGGLLRGEQKLAKPLWHCIESETDDDSLYYLLRLGAIVADPNIVPILQKFAEKVPESAAELLALHGTEEALRALLDLSQTSKQSKPPAGILEAWYWVSGRSLIVKPRLRVVQPGETSAPALTLNSVEWWWQEHHSLLQEGGRFLFGQTLSLKHMFRQSGLQAGRFSNNLLDLLSYSFGSPIGVTARATQLQRRRVLQLKSPQDIEKEETHASA
ncbi:MAG: hypothetical protein WBB23_24285 [Desulforhopalus sp.]